MQENPKFTDEHYVYVILFKNEKSRKNIELFSIDITRFIVSLPSWYGTLGNILISYLL